MFRLEENESQNLNKKTDIHFLEPIYPNLCNVIDCGLGTCVVTSRNLTFCQCVSGITGPNCDQRMFKFAKISTKPMKFFF